VNPLSRCYYHPRTSSVITDRNLLDSATVNGLLNLLPEHERHGLKYVAVCLEDGVAGEVDRDSLVAALEVFGQIRDSGVSPKDILREVNEKAGKIAPVVKARNLAAPKEVAGSSPDKPAANSKRNSRRPIKGQ